MKRALKMILSPVTGCLILMSSQQAIAQVAIEPESTETEQNINGAVLGDFLRFLNSPNIEPAELEFLDSQPLLQSDIPIRRENEVICDSEGRSLEAGGWADNGDGTFRMGAGPDAVCCLQ